MGAEPMRSDRILGIVPKVWVTPLTIAVFTVIGVSGLMLFFGFFEGQVKEMHEWLGVAFVLVALLHVAKNWRPFTLMLRLPAMKASVGAVALAATVFVVGATMGGGERGNPVRAVAQAVETAPLETAAAVFGLTRDEVLTRLHDAGIDASAEARTLAEIGQQTGVESMRVLAAVTADRAE